MMDGMDKSMAYRQVATIEAGDDGVIEGYALYWDRPASLYAGSDEFMESYDPDAFTSALKSSDPMLKVEHRGSPLARRSAGNFHVDADSKGLRYRAELDIESDYEARAMHSRVRRGVIKGASVGWLIPGSKVESERNADGQTHDRVVEVSELREISLVGRPVHESTAVARAVADAPEDNHSSRSQRLGLQRRLLLCRVQTLRRD